jgi:hypothetical protein
LEIYICESVLYTYINRNIFLLNRPFYHYVINFFVSREKMMLGMEEVTKTDKLKGHKEQFLEKQRSDNSGDARWDLRQGQFRASVYDSWFSGQYEPFGIHGSWYLDPLCICHCGVEQAKQGQNW